MQNIRLIFKSFEGELPSLKNQKRWKKGNLMFIYTMIDPQQITGINCKAIVKI